MAARTANALWEGSLQEGRGQMSLGSGAFEGAYSFKSRFGEEDTGTNPEELIAAAHAGCFTMALSLALSEAGNPPESLQTQAKVSLRNVDALPDDHEGRAHHPRPRARARRRGLPEGRRGRQGGLRRLARPGGRGRDHARGDARG